MSAPTTTGDPLPHPRTPTLAPPRLERIPAEEADRLDLRGSAPYVAFHVLAALGALWWPPTAADLLLCLGLVYARLLGISIGYHRYFAHRAFRTSRAFQLLLAIWAQTSLQRGVLWWAGHHRNHHRYADHPEDLHSPARRGFFWSHVGWILCGRYERTPLERIPDMARFPELRWLDRHWAVPAAGLALGLLVLGGPSALLWGFGVGTVLLWHLTYSINSLAHRFGTRRFATTDTSRNNFWLALLTVGEGWHNNHHYYAPSARLGFRWWEVDPSWYVLWSLERLGVVWDLRRPPHRPRPSVPRRRVRTAA